MNRPKLAAGVSYVLHVLSAVIAIAFTPFVIFAGVGLLLVLPFGFFSYTEITITKAIRSGLPVSRRERKHRVLRILGCVLGSEIFLGLLWLTNSSDTPNDNLAPSLYSNASQSLIAASIAMAVITIIMLSPQFLYQKSK